MNQSLAIATILCSVLGCASPQPMPGKEVSIDAVKVQLLSIVGPKAALWDGETQYTPKDPNLELYAVNLRYTGTGKVEPLATSLQPLPEELLLAVPKVVPCCYSDGVALQNPFSRIQQGLDFYKTNSFTFQLNASSEQRTLFLVFPKGKRPESLRFKIGQQEGSIAL